MKQVLGDAAIADELSRNGLAAIHGAHTCRHRVQELLAIVGSLSGVARPAVHAERRQMEAVQ
jgi:spore maturation protein CgeB